MSYYDNFSLNSALKVEREQVWGLEPNKHVYKVTLPVFMSKVIPNDDIYKTYGNKLFLHTEFEIKIIANSEASIVEVENQAKITLKSMLASDSVFDF
ncbi:hypothetical protein DM558_03925 [Entomomonas moraniae]|uniref:Uncharacterized protein n=1 Tax=Entomomonas moraniae TaxID=2213226 RepID=A0A3S9XC55_9GAMM|nr:hypothetical protein [Entomomonas moraniae]AZS49975.1 hypothetical protein DM558_03925 [Entomomonas moraniae]